MAVELNETKGTFHGYDVVLDRDTTKNAAARRIDFMKRMFNSEKQTQ